MFWILPVSSLYGVGIVSKGHLNKGDSRKLGIYEIHEEITGVCIKNYVIQAVLKDVAEKSLQS